MTARVGGLMSALVVFALKGGRHCTMARGLHRQAIPPNQFASKTARRNVHELTNSKDDRLCWRKDAS